MPPPPKRLGCIGPAVFAVLTLGCAATMLTRCGDNIPTLSAAPNRTPGTAVYLLLDVSGSMADAVPNAAGAREAKLAIAQRAAIDVCRTIAKYADEDKSRTIRVAVASFSDDFLITAAMDQPHPDALAQAINHLTTRGGTAIGDAVIQAQQALDQTHLSGQHILILTDGENNQGHTPAAVAAAINRLPAELRPSVYIVAFDVNAAVFDKVKAQGWQVFPAANGAQLQQQLDEVVGGHILIEK